MKLLGSLTSPYVRKVRIVAAEKRIDLPLEVHNPTAADTRVPEFNPLGKVPVLVREDGMALFDSRVIAEFLDSVSPISKLIPADNRERIEVKCWEALADGILDAAVLARMESQRPEKERSAAWIERQMGKAQRGITEMEKRLDGKPWCVGNSITLADIAVGACLGYLDFRFAKLDWRKDHPQLARHAAKLMERPSFADTVPHD